MFSNKDTAIMLLKGGGASTLNHDILGKFNLFAYHGRTFHYLQLKKMSLRQKMCLRHEFLCQSL